MRAKRSIARWSVGVLLCAASFAALPVRAQEAPTADAPVKKDVPYVPTQREVVEEMLKLVDVKASDVVYDLGCGDGRIVIAAAKRSGCRGIGIDIDPQRIRESKENAAREGVTDKVKFVIQDLFATDFRDATVLTMYLLPEVNMKLRPTILNDLKPGTRIVSHDFDMEDWEPDQKVEMEGDGATVFFWIVPAKVEGTWNGTVRGNGRPQQPATLHLKQQFQKVSGTVDIAGKTHPISDGSLRGAELTFTLPTGANGSLVKYTCNVNGNKMDGVTQVGTGHDGPVNGASATSRSAEPHGDATLAATRVEGNGAEQGADKPPRP